MKNILKVLAVVISILTLGVVVLAITTGEDFKPKNYI